MTSSSTTKIGLLPAPDTTPVSTVVYTRADNQVQMDGASVTVLIDGSDIVLKSADGKVLILPLAAQLASYERNLFKLVFADGRVMTSDDLLAVGKVVSVAPANTEDAAKKNANQHEQPQTVEKVVEKIVEKIVEKVIVVEPEPEVEPTTPSSQGGPKDALNLTKPLSVHTSDNEAVPVVASSSGSVHKSDAPVGAVLIPPTPVEPDVPVVPVNPVEPVDPVDPVDPIVPIDPVVPVDPVTPVDPGLPIPPNAPGKLFQVAPVIDIDQSIYRGGGGTDGSQSDPSPAMQYGVKTIDLSGETVGWNVYTDDPERFSADQMTRVISLNGALGVVHVSAGLPDHYTTVEYGTAEGDRYGLQAGQVLLIYPTGRHDSLALTFQYQTADGTQQEIISFVVVDEPYTIQRDDGTYLLASSFGKSYVITGSGNDIVHAGFTSSEIHTGDGNDTIIASMASATYDGGNGFDTVDYSAIGGALVVNMIDGGVAVDGTSLHKLTSIDQVIGSDHGDRMIAGNTDVVFLGGKGDDVFVSGLGNSVFDGGAGFNTVDFSQSTDVNGVTASLAKGTTGVGLNGSGGTDTLSNIQAIIGSKYNDRLEGNEFDNTIYAGDGDDWVVGSVGSDLLDGGAGRNTLDYSAFVTSLNINLVTGVVDKGVGTDGKKTVDSISGFIEVFGGAGGDTFTTVAGATLHGGAGNDTFIGGVGNSTFDGGAGHDTVDYTNVTSSLYVNLNTGVAAEFGSQRIGGVLTFVANTAGVFGRDTLTGIEDVVGSLSAGTNYLEGGGGDSKLVGGRNTNYMLGNTGNNTLDGSKGSADYAIYSSAKSGVTAVLDAAKNGEVAHDGYKDTLQGIEGLWGSAYDDVLQASVIGTWLYGGAGNNTLTGGTAYYYWGTQKGIVVDLGGGGHTGALENGFGGQDTLININRVVGSYGYDDVIWGNNNDNIITEYSGNNIIYGSRGNDTMNLSGGSNTINYSLMTAGIVADLSKASVIKGVSGALGTDKFSGNGISNITGTSFADTITGDGGNNILNGNGGSDILIGNAGNDILIGGEDGLTAASYTTSPNGIVANLSSGQVNDGFGGIDTLIQIGKIIGSARADQFNFSTQADLSRYQIEGNGGNDIMVKQGAAGSYALDGSVRISGIKTIEFSDSKVDRISIDLNGLFSGAGTSQNLTIHTDASDVVSITQSGWTMTENTTNHQTWTHGSDTVTVSH